jgi:23S rRNA (guanosine2251-2'-O)-methyltransferase
VVAELAGGPAAGDNTLAREADLWAHLEALDHPPLVLVLDGVTDPHNLGACLRSADAAGVDAVILPKDKSASVTPVVRKVACGAAETVPLHAATNLARVLKGLKERGIWLYGAAGEARSSLYAQDLTGPAALVLGSEGAGLRRLTREHCDFLVHLPMAGAVSSLNVSVATGVCLFEVVRQRTADPR